MKIDKQSTDSNRLARTWHDFPRARDAFESYLLSLGLSESDHILVPNYIGYSTREGSGVFDPIINSAVNYRFYELDENLEVNMNSMRKLIALGGVKLIVIIHYFGYVDPSYNKIINLARENGIKVLEDQAHSLFTDLYSGSTGRLCDASIYSLHKMFPVETGGAISFTDGFSSSVSSNVSRLCLDYDIPKIAIARIDNYNFLKSKLSDFSTVLSILRPSLFQGSVPQTFPILIHTKNRDEIYHLMNDSGFGVVSLYHTMIEEISRNDEYVTNEISKNILNLPVHQGASKEALEEMCNFLINILLAD